MAYRRYLHVSVLGLITIMLFGVGGAWAYPNVDTDNNQTNFLADSLTPRSVIRIFSNSEFSALGFPGSGSSADPYLIEGFNITSNDDLIAISDTNAFFVIKNNYLNGLSTNQGFAITLSNVQNGLIENNTILDVTLDGISMVSSTKMEIKNNYIEGTGVFGIFFSESNDNSIVNNTITNNGETGIRLDSSNGNIVEYNTVWNNYFAEIGLSFSSQNSISFNEVFDNDFAGGIYIGSESKFNSVSNNTVHGNGVGLRLEARADYNKLIGNQVFDNIDAIHMEFASYNSLQQNSMYANDYGIRVRNGDRLGISKSNLISSNIAFNNAFHTVLFETMSQGNKVTNNDFSNNGLFVQQAFDEGTNNSFSGNFWSDWDRLGAYDINGLAQNQDLSPKSSSLHIGTTTVTVEDAGMDSLSGSITISWDPVLDSMNHSISYAVSYMTRDGISTEIVSGLSDTSYTIDTTIIPDGSVAYISVNTIDNFKFSSESLSDKIYLVFNSEHSFTTPILAAPGYNETLSGDIEISWTPANDSWEAHSVKYSVFYLSSTDTTWVPIATELTTTSVIWDTSKLADGSYLIKVVALGSGGFWTEVVSNSTFTLRNDPFIGIQTDGSLLPFTSGYSIIFAFILSLIAYKKKRKIVKNVQINN